MWAHLRQQQKGETKSSPGPASCEDDGLDELMRSLSTSASSKEKNFSAACAEESATTNKGSMDDDDDDECDEDVLSAYEAIQQLRLGLADPSVNEEVADRLAMVDDCGEGFVEYYRKKTNLREYTLNVELRRNAFEVSVDGEAAGVDALATARGDDELVVRLANQSVFADVICELSQTLETHGLNKVGAAVGAAQKGGSYALSLGNNRSLRASLDLEVSVPTECDKLVLASFPCQVCVLVSGGFPRPRRTVDRARLTRIFDEDVLDAARFLARVAREGPCSAPPAPTIVGPSRVLRAAARGVSGIMTSLDEAGRRLAASSPPVPPRSISPPVWSSTRFFSRASDPGIIIQETQCQDHHHHQDPLSTRTSPTLSSSASVSDNNNNNNNDDTRLLAELLDSRLGYA